MKKTPKNVVKPAYFAYWSDLFGFPIAEWLLPWVIRVNFLTPNVISVLSFALLVAGSLFLFITFPYHLIISALSLFVAFILDDLDGQVARIRKLSSKFGDYLDKFLDMLKIYILTICLSYACLIRTGDIFYIFLGFTACFFYMYRSYIKYAVMFSRIDADPQYLEKSQKEKEKILDKITIYFSELSKTIMGRVKLFFIQNRTIVFVDETEFAVFTAFFALINQLEIGMWVLAISQIIISIFKTVERGYQLIYAPEQLLRPMRK